MISFYLILIFLISYLLGSFPTGYLVVKKFAGKAQASLIGILGVLSFKFLLLPWGGIAIIYILVLGYLFLGQSMGTIFLPIVAYFLIPEYFWVSLLMAIPIFIKQWPRFIPMLKGQEPKWYWKMRKEKK